MIVGECTARHQCGHNRNLHEFGKFAHHFCCVCFENTTAEIQQRLLGFKNHLCCFFDHLRMTFCCWSVTRKRINYFFICRPMPSHRCLQHVLRKIEKNRTRAASCCNVECLTDSHRDVVWMHDEFVVLRDTAGDTDGVALLECVGSDCCC